MKVTSVFHLQVEEDSQDQTITLLDNCVAPKLIIFKIENPSTYLKKQKYKDIFGLKEICYIFRTQEETQVLQNIKIHAGMED